jgi:hypothetical protein
MKNVDAPRFVWFTQDKFVVLCSRSVEALVDTSHDGNDWMMGSYKCMAFSTPHSKFRDVTLARNVVKDCIREPWLADLVQTMNRYLLPMIQCPVIRFIYIKLVKYDLSLLSWIWAVGWHKHTCTPMTSWVKYNYVAVPCAHKKTCSHEQYADLQN